MFISKVGGTVELSAVGKELLWEYRERWTG
jgi:hypothetical protein